jgi:hypothetical protein
MRFGTHLKISDDRILTVCFPAEETKGKRLLQYALHSACADHLLCYLENVRPIYAVRGFSDGLWLNPEGQMLSSVEIAAVFRQRIKSWVGEEHGPHTARKWLRSSASRRSPEAALDAAQVLGHSPAVSLRHYAEATDRQATRRHASNLSQLRKRTRSLADRLYAGE